MQRQWIISASRKPVNFERIAICMQLIDETKPATCLIERKTCRAVIVNVGNALCNLRPLYILLQANARIARSIGLKPLRGFTMRDKKSLERSDFVFENPRASDDVTLRGTSVVFCTRIKIYIRDTFELCFGPIRAYIRYTVWIVRLAAQNLPDRSASAKLKPHE